MDTSWVMSILVIKGRQWYKNSKCYDNIINDESNDIEETYHDNSNKESLTDDNGVNNEDSESNGDPINKGFIDLIDTHVGVTWTSLKG